MPYINDNNKTIIQTTTQTKEATTMKNGQYYRSNTEEAVDALCDDCASQHDYSPYEYITLTDDETCYLCGQPIYTH